MIVSRSSAGALILRRPKAPTAGQRAPDARSTPRGGFAPSTGVQRKGKSGAKRVRTRAAGRVSAGPVRNLQRPSTKAGPIGRSIGAASARPRLGVADPAGPRRQRRSRRAGARSRDDGNAPPPTRRLLGGRRPPTTGARDRVDPRKSSTAKQFSPGNSPRYRCQSFRGGRNVDLVSSPRLSICCG